MRGDGTAGHDRGRTRAAGDIEHVHPGREVEGRDRPVGGAGEEAEGAVVASVGGGIVGGDGSRHGGIQRTATGPSRTRGQVDTDRHAGRVVLACRVGYRPMSAAGMDG